MGGAAGRADAGRGRRGPNSIAGTPKGGLAVGWPRADSGGEGSSSSVARRAVRRAAVDMSTATTTAACSRARAARAHHTLKLGPRIYGPRRCLYLCPGGLCFPDPTSAGGSFPPSRAGGFLRRERPVVEERRRARAACDLEGNRAGLGCLEHLRMCLSFAVVTEWPVGVYPRRRRWSPPHACLVRAVGQSSPCECMSG